MFEIRVEPGGRVHLTGRLDAAESEKALPVFCALQGPTIMDCSGLDYISSTGIGVIMDTYKRLHGGGHTLQLVNTTRRVKNVFTFAGLDRLLGIE